MDQSCEDSSKVTWGQKRVSRGVRVRTMLFICCLYIMMFYNIVL